LIEKETSMKIKSLLAVAIVFSTVFCLCSCRKVENNSVTTKEAYYVKAEDGEEYEIETKSDENTGETEYFYVDNGGNVVNLQAESSGLGKTKFYAVDSSGNKKEVETKTVTVTETKQFDDISLTPEQESFIDNFEGEKMEDYLDQTQEEVTLALGNEVHDLEDAKEVDPSKVKHNPNYIADFAQSEKYTLKMTIRNESTAMPVTVVRSGNKMYISTSMPVEDQGTMSANIIINGNKCKVFIPNIRGYYEVPIDSIEDITKEIDVGTTAPDESKKTGTVQATDANGIIYDVDMYTESNGDTVSYWYNGDTLTRVEYISADGSSTIVEYNELSYTADEKVFVEPQGYFNMTDMMAAGDSILTTKN
jgi:hypothetical protein